MDNKPDWEAVRREYEAGGLSLANLAKKHGVSKTYLIEKRDKGEWIRPTDRPGNRPTDQSTSPLHLLRPALPMPSPANAKEGANLGLDALVTYLKQHRQEMDLSDHVKASNALAQYNKVFVNALPDEDEEQDETELITIDTRELSSDQLTKLKAFASEMKASEQTG